MSRIFRFRCVAASVALSVLLASEAAAAGLRGPSGLPLPRFVSVKAAEANVRLGPGTSYGVKWTFVRHGLPVEIYQEFGNWRRIRDWTGEDGWIFGPLLSGRRTALVEPWSDGDAAKLKTRPDGRVTAVLEPGVVVRLRGCDGTWCEVATSAVSGFVRQDRLWGVYPGERFD